MGTTGYFFGYKRRGAMLVDDKGSPYQSESHCHNPNFDHVNIILHLPYTAIQKRGVWHICGV